MRVLMKLIRVRERCEASGRAVLKPSMLRQATKRTHNEGDRSTWRDRRDDVSKAEPNAANRGRENGPLVDKHALLIILRRPSRT